MMPEEIVYPSTIPWKLVATSQDMMDFTPGNRKFPPKWKSSMAFFQHEPAIDPDILGDRKIVYLKVVCSITGFQVDDNELGVNVDSAAEWDSRVYQNFNRLIRDYYPCYGALLHLAVFPRERGDHESYPYIIDFEPKKREMFEVVTETGEVMSRSLHNLQVQTGGTSTTSMETIDVDKGWSLKLEGEGGKKPGAYGKGSVALGANYEAGYKAMSQGQNVNLRNIDASQEAKETLSATTELQQMYHLLDSYHLGTNRALFVVTPRPHIVDQEFSVTNGPRRLEGIQEFFLVVSLPKDSEGYCIEGQLETSHLHKNTRVSVSGTTEYEEGQIEQKIKDKVTCGLWDYTLHIKRTYSIPVPGGYMVDRSKGNGHGYDEHRKKRDDIDSHNVMVYDDRIDVEVTFGPDNPGDSATFEYDYTVYYKSIDPVSEPVEETITDIDLFMTGRYLEGCVSWGTGNFTFFDPGFDRNQYVVFEQRLPDKYKHLFKEISRIPKATPKLRATLNELQVYIHDQTLSSVNNPDRYPIGEHSLMDTDFALRSLRKDPWENRFHRNDYQQKVHLNDYFFKKINDARVAKELQRMTLADLAKSDSKSLTRVTRLELKDVLLLKKMNLGVDAQRRY